MAASSTPPRPHAALRVGVTGHRLNRLLEPDVDLTALEGAVRDVLEAIADRTTALTATYRTVYSGPPLLRLISPLAEGADQIVADVALTLGYRLHVPLPALPQRYVGGFQRPSQPVREDPCVRFERLYSQAESVQVLDGSPDAALFPESYAAVGHTVLRHSDLLISIWDGSPADGPGGTGAVVAQARAWQVPLVLIDPTAPKWWHVDGECGESPRTDLATTVERVLAPPIEVTETELDERADIAGPSRTVDADGQARPPSRALIEYLHTRPTPWWGGLFNFLVAIAALEWPFRSAPLRLGKQSIARARAGWDRMWKTPSPVDPTITDPISHTVREYFAWSDGLADRFGTAYRDASVGPFLLAPLTVILAVVAQVVLAREQIDAVIQVLVTFALLSLNCVLYLLMARRKWHARWIDYRSLAEELRHLAFLWPLGRPLRSIVLPNEAMTEAPQFAWVAWYGRAVARQAGIFPCVFTADRIAACRAMLVEHFLHPQCQYHGRTRDRFVVVQERLHWTALILFGAMTLLAAVDVVLAFRAPPPVAQTPLSSGFGWRVCAAALALVVPYIATSTHGFLSQGDFFNLSRRSHRMCQQLEPLMTRILATPPTLEGLGTFAEDAADIMRDEVLNWRVFVRLKPPALS